MSDIFRNYGVLYNDNSLLCVFTEEAPQKELSTNISIFTSKVKPRKKWACFILDVYVGLGVGMSVCLCVCVSVYVCVYTCTCIHGCMWKAGDESGHNVADGPGRSWLSVHVTTSVRRHLVDASGKQARGPDVSVRPCHLLLGPTTRHPRLQWC